MNEIARQVIDRYRAKALERGVRLRLEPRLGLPPAMGDAKSLERALMALVDNSIKFSPKGGDVTMLLRETKDSILVAVEDHGIGMSKDTMPRIFDRFYHLERHEDNLFGGIGLGLSITRQVIKQHQGTLEVTSEPGKGSTFTLTLKKWRM
jgi:two-component system phosphate regulon sensor histidine kinase PhoR